jgi:xanthine dehydrogenase small subunit
MIEHGGSQCGYCTPGFVLSLFAEFHSAKRDFDDAVVEGNLCRCTGYNSIRRAMRALQKTATFALPALPPASAPVSASPWLMRPTNLVEALALKQAHPDAGWLAGATDLGLEFSRDALHPKPLIAIDHLPELLTLTLADDGLSIGAGVTLTRLQQALIGTPIGADPELSAHRHGALFGLYTMLHWFAAQQVRNRATVGGNIGTGSPIGDLLPVLLALDAALILRSARGARHVALADYFLGYRKTLLAADELIDKVTLSLKTTAARRFTQSYKVGKRGSDDISIVAACFVIDVDANNVVQHARMAYGGVAATPIRALAAEASLLGQAFTPELAARVQPLLQAELQPLSDFRASAHYRRRLLSALFEKFLHEMGVVAVNS